MFGEPRATAFLFQNKFDYEPLNFWSQKKKINTTRDVKSFVLIYNLGMRYMEHQTQNPMRFIALATSVANYNDLADWIGARARYNFPLSNRPMPLETKLVGSDINSYEDRQIALLRPCYAHIGRYSPNNPVIIFAPNRKYTRTIASDLMALAAAEVNKHIFCFFC